MEKIIVLSINAETMTDDEKKIALELGFTPVSSIFSHYSHSALIFSFNLNYIECVKYRLEQIKKSGLNFNLEFSIDFKRKTNATFPEKIALERGFSIEEIKKAFKIFDKKVSI